MENFDVIVIGGGPAGLSAGIGLARAGHRVTVIEKHGYPRHKVCGEYLSREILPFLETLGIWLPPARFPAISKLNVSTPDGRMAQAHLPLGGIGISRFELDNLLYHAALDAGCHFIFEEVLQVGLADGQFRIGTRNGNCYTARLAIGAYGRKSVVDHGLKRDFAGSGPKWLGVKAHYRIDIEPDRVGLYLFPGGYCGVSMVEGGLVNVCYLASVKSFAPFRNPEAFTREALAKNTALGQLLSGAQMDFERPLVISDISFAKKSRVENNVLMLGDAAQMIHPLTGNGMAMAIGSAEIAVPLADGFLRGTIPLGEFHARYDRDWKQRFGSRVAFGRLLGQIMLNRSWSRFGMRFLQWFPGILPKLVSMTHGHPKPDFSRRSDLPEIMDDFALKGAELRDALNKIARINQFLGGNRVTLQGVSALLGSCKGPVHIVDYGCGNGDMLRQLARWGRQRRLQLQLTGIDANAFTIGVANQQSEQYPEIVYRCADFLKSDHREDCDIALFTLTLHHFQDPALLELLERMKATARLGIVVNDLHRSPVAYRLFKTICAVFGLNRMSREDGLVSILRGFTGNDLARYCKILKIEPNIRWKWAFRYRWIIKNT